ncbi:MAG TPA: ABC transporter substrate-binding protein [Armatimonadota bacterium]|nr:ABC transporter substrate-binding protein [Armatimonadota bacterium]
MNKKFLMVIVLVILAGLVLWLVKAPNPDSKGSIKIGAVLPLTGSAAPYGKNAQRGIELALAEINGRGGVQSKPLQVMFEDSKTDPKEAVGALNKLHSQGINFIIGDINSSGVLAMAPIAEREKILLLSPGASNPKISSAGDFIFRNWHSDALEGQVDADYAHTKLHWKRAAVLYVNAAYGAGLASTFKKVFEDHGRDVVAYEAYAQDAADMREQITKILSANPDGLYLPGWPKEMSVALRQLKQLGWNKLILSAQGFDDPLVLKLAGPAAEGVIYSVPKSPDSHDPVVGDFQSNYRKQYGQEPGVCSASGYDALRIYAYAIGEAGTGTQKVQKTMAKLRGFAGADGPVTFDKNGDLLKPFEFKVIRNGRSATTNQD